MWYSLTHTVLYILCKLCHVWYSFWCLAFDDKQILNRQPRVPSGITAILKCDSLEEIKWFFQDTNSEIVSTSSNLIMFSLTPKQSGTYICLGKYKNEEKYFMSQTTLDVIGKLSLFNIYYNYIIIRSASKLIILRSGRYIQIRLWCSFLVLLLLVVVILLLFV